MGKLIWTTTIALCCCMAMAAQALAAAGEPDTSFGSNGNLKLAPPPGTGGWNVWDAVAAPDGKTYAGGTAQACPAQGGACVRRVFVARYLEDGSLDPSYGDGGYATVSDPNWAAGAIGVTADRSGRVLVATVDTPPAPTGLTVTRLDTAGNRDVTFGPGGSTFIPCGCFYELPILLVDPEGRVVVGGHLSDLSIRLTRLLAGGVVDQSYGIDGTVAVGVNAWQGVLRQNGSIVMPVFTQGQGQSLMRISGNGRGIDRAFNTTKQLRGRKVRSLATLPGNRLAVLGTQSRGTQSFVMAIGGGGGIVSRFAHRGIALANFAVLGIAGDNNGRVLLAGVQAEQGTGGPREGRGVLRRRLSNGKPDKNFANGLAGIKSSTEIPFDPFYNGNRPFVFQWSSFVPECRSYCPPDPHLFRFRG